MSLAIKKNNAMVDVAISVLENINTQRKTADHSEQRQQRKASNYIVGTKHNVYVIQSPNLES